VLRQSQKYDEKVIKERSRASSSSRPVCLEMKLAMAEKSVSVSRYGVGFDGRCLIRPASRLAVYRKRPSAMSDAILN
jgi:hypothetical protein